MKKEKILIREGNEGSWKKKGIENRRCIVCSKSFKAFNYTRHPRGKRLKEENIRPFNCVTCSKKCSKLKLDIGRNLLTNSRKLFKEKIQNAQKRIKEEIPEWLTNKQELGGTLFNIHLIIDKIFKEEFGGRLK